MLKKISLENFNATVCNMIMQGSSISVETTDQYWGLKKGFKV